MNDEAKNINNGPAGSISALHHYWHIVLKWKWLAAIFFFVILGGVTLYTLLIPRSYVSRGTIWVESQLNILPFEDVQQLDSMDLSPQSYAQLLRSRALASAVIDKLKLYERIGFAGKPARGETLPSPTDPVFRENLIEKFLEQTSVRPIERTKLLEVTFSDSNPRFAAEILNAVFNEYIDMIIGQKFQASEQASRFLKSQIASLRTEIEGDEKKLAEYGTSKDILPLSSTETPTVTRLAEVNKALTTATLERVNKYDVYNQLKAGNFSEFPGGPADSPARRLSDQYTTLSQEYARRLTVLRPEYPEMKRLKSQVESQKMVDNAYSEYVAAQKKEQSLKDLLDQIRNEAYRTNSSSLAYNTLRIELDNKKTLLESLSKRETETILSGRLKSAEATNTWVVDKASLPLKPAFPDRRKNVLFGLIAGLVGGLGLALGIEYLDNTAKTSKDISTAVGFTTLGVIPGFGGPSDAGGIKAEAERLTAILRGRAEPAGKRSGSNGSYYEHNDHPRKHAGKKRHGLDLILARHPNSIQSESFRSLKTTLLVSYPARQYKVLIFTSPLSGEGKSSIVSNLGLSLAQANKRVVIVDADMRRPKQRRIFDRKTEGPGLSDYITSRVELQDLVVPTGHSNLFLIESGAQPEDPVEVLTSDKMNDLVTQLKRGFDYVLFDTPPLLAVADTIALGPLAEGMIIVVRAGQTPVPALKQAAQKLDLHKIQCLGVILNDVDLIEQDGYYAHQYYRYSRHD